MSIDLSLIITTYNRPRELGEVLAGVAGQTRWPDEVIVADDGSTRETARCLARIRNGFPAHIVHVRHEDLGFRAAKIRNEAVKKAHGDYLVFLDGDCIPGPDFIADHLRLAATGVFVQGKRILVHQEAAATFTARDTRSPFLLLQLLFAGKLGNGHHLLRLWWPAKKSKKMAGIKSCNLGIWKRDLYAVNGFNEDFVGWGREDSELAARLFALGLSRKDHPFLAACFHLWHPENDRSRLEANDALLAKTIESHEYMCTNGLVKPQKDE